MGSEYMTQCSKCLLTLHSLGGALKIAGKFIVVTGVVYLLATSPCLG